MQNEVGFATELIKVMNKVMLSVFVVMRYARNGMRKGIRLHKGKNKQNTKHQCIEHARLR